MKTVGIVILFALCTAIGWRLAAKKSERIAAICALRRDLSVFSDAFDAGEGSLSAIAQRGQGLLMQQLNVYLATLRDGRSEQEAARIAAEPLAPDALFEAARLFFGGLSQCPRTEIQARIERFLHALDAAERDAAPQGKQAKLIRAVGVLTGAALAVLLI